MTTRSTIVALTAALSTCVGATADLKTWSPSNGDISWHTATNWSPNGVPADGDDVQVYVPTFVTLDQDTENVRSLSISGGAYVTTFGHTLAVVDAGDALTSVTGDDTWLVVEPTGGTAFATDRLQLVAGGKLIMNGGHMIAVALDNFDGFIEGSGEITVGSGDFNNGGLLRASYGLLTLTGGLGSSVDLDGVVGSGAIQIDHASELRVERPITDPISTAVVMYGNAVADVRTPWATTSTGELRVDAWDYDARLRGQPFAHHGLLNIVSGALRVETDLFMAFDTQSTGSGELIIDEQGLLDVEDGIDVGVDVRVEGALESGANWRIGTARFEEDLTLTDTSRVRIELRDETCDQFDVDGRIRFDGRLDVELFPHSTQPVRDREWVIIQSDEQIFGTFDEYQVPPGHSLRYWERSVTIIADGDCDGDIVPDGVVDVDDLIQLMSNWGGGPDNVADVDGDGDADANDLIVMLAAWGVCP